MLRHRTLTGNAQLLRRGVLPITGKRSIAHPILRPQSTTSTPIPTPTPVSKGPSPSLKGELNELENENRQSASFFISNVLPIKLAYWDFRPAIARVREDAVMEQLSDIASEISGHGFRIESWEISRKDGGVFMHFSYIPPTDEEIIRTRSEKEREEDVNKELSAINALPERTYARPSSPGRLFLPKLVASAKKHGGFPSWLGQAWANWTNGQTGDMGRVPGHELYATRTAGSGSGSGAANELEVATVDGTVIKGTGSGMRGIQAMAGVGRVWLVKGRQWTEVSLSLPSVPFLPPIEPSQPQSKC